jgi:RHS repeat-associated protein
LGEGAEIINTGTFNANAEPSGRQTISGGTEGSFVNKGTLGKSSGAGTSEIAVPVENKGTVDPEKGKLAFGYGGTSLASSQWEAAASAEVRFTNGTFSMKGGTLADAITVAGGTVDAEGINGPKAKVTDASGGSLSMQTGTMTLESLVMAGGILTGAATLDVSGSLSWEEEGPMEGSGSTVILPGATASTAAMKGTYISIYKRRIVNEGTFTAAVGDISLGEGAEIINTGTFNANAEPSGRQTISGGTEGSVINRGLFEKTSGGGTSMVTPPFENLGVVRELTGHLNIEHPIVTSRETQWGGEPESGSTTPGQIKACAGDPVSCATGNDTETQTDFAIGGRGVGLDLTRTYNSQAAAEGIKGAFGYGWSSSFSDHLVVEKANKKVILHQANGATVTFTESGGESFTAPPSTQDVLSGSEASGYTLTIADQTKYKFAGSSGRVESVTDRDGNATTLTYNGSGQLTTITDPVSRTIKLTYNGEGLVESAEDPTKHTVKYTYEGGNLKSVTQPAEESLRWQFKYNGEHELTEMTDGRGGKTINEYSGSHQVTKQEDPAGRKLKFEYETFHTKITNENTSSVTNEFFTSSDEPSSITRGFGTASETTESFTYNEGGYVTSVTNGDGHVTKYGYNSTNDRTSMIDPDEDQTKWEYNSTHDVISVTTPKGETTTIKREAHGNPETIERPAPESKTQVTKYKYTATGELESVEDSLKRVWKYEYDAKGDRMAEIDPLTNKRTWEYNEDSQEIATVSPRGHVKAGEEEKFETKIERDAQGRPLTITDPLKHTTKYKYDGDGNVEQVTDGNSHTTKYTYNGDNQPIKVEAPNKALTETEYDGAGQVIKQVDGNKHATKYTRNAIEEVAEVTDPLGHVTKKEYDAAGNLKKLEDPAKRTTTYKYDPANRLEEISYSSGKPSTVTYEYDKDGDRTMMVDGTGTSKYTYDQLDRLTESENGRKEVIKYEYDLANEQTKIIYPNKKAVTRAFDKDGRLEKLTDWLSHSTKFTYNEDSDLKTIVFPTEPKDEDKYTYNDADLMTEVKMDKSTEVLASLLYTRDNDGQVKKTTSKGLPGAEVTENTYDENSRLTKYGSTEYKYDPANNPTKEGSSTNTFNEGDELEKGTGTTYAYDELGERTKMTPEKGGATTYGYDQAGNLTSVERPEKESIPKIEDAYAYDGEGLRISQTISGTTTYLAWDMAEGLPQILSDGTNSYIYGPAGVPVEQISGAETPTYLHHDQQGSIRLLTGSAGTTTGSITFDAYGNKVESTGTTTPLGYDGQYTSSDTGLIYLRARTYDPATAQFLTVDPLVGITGAPYGYTEDNPLNMGDPTGLLFGISGTPSFSEVGEEVVNVGSKALHAGLVLAAVPPYAIYYASYQAAREINSLGSNLGVPGEVASHIAAAPLIPDEAFGLATDALLDWIKGHTVNNESICDEGVEGYINPFHSFVSNPLKGPIVYLPGIHENGSIDFQW